jgi:hypothetical protein
MVVARRMCLIAFLAAAVAASGAANVARGVTPDESPYAGLGTWVSIYDTAAWRDPETTIDAIAARGVTTLFLETSNFRQKSDVVRRPIVGRFIEAAHAYGLAVVGWYLPSLAQPARDRRRALAGLQFVTSDGDGFDSFALDLESTAVRSIPLRNARAAALAAQLRASAPPDYPLGAITIAPVGASPTYWPTYPFAALAPSVDVFLPMAYFTARVRGAAAVRAYTVANIRLIRTQTGDPSVAVHPIAGTAPRATRAETAAFVAAAVACGSLGSSLWEFAATTPGEWAELESATSLVPASARSC